ncbi:PLP-dependent aminotransferase family protein, partial [Pseudomonas sp.]|uniref:aminotransferase-like domain-containing protein n=1 Tax=Pseudomonas sp. TaxID=306 RepID=UPI003CC549CD
RSQRRRPGTRLPTHRELARREGLALVTASRVYAALANMGLVSGETGRGTFVRETQLPPGHGVDQPEVASGMLDLNFNYPSLPGQAELLRVALRNLAATGDLEALLRYQPHAGRPVERAAVASHVQALGLDVSGDQVLMVTGAQHGLAVAVMGLLQPGDVVAVDALTYPGFKVVADSHRIELAPIAAQGQGPNLDALEALCRQRRVKAVYSMPTLHNPLGWVMEAGPRQRLADIARRHDLILIEDAAYAFLVDDAPPPLATFAPERTVYVSGFSKSVATGLRVGFVLAPLPWVGAMERMIRATNWNTPGVMTAITCQWLKDGTVARCEADKRLDAQARQALASEVLKGMPMVRHASSYFVWLPLPEDMRADQVAMALMREQVSVSTAEPFATSAAVPHAIRLALGSVDRVRLREALERVRRVIGAYV